MIHAANPAPALSRGLDMLRRLEADGPASLESLTHATAWPKSSVSRILQSLELAGAVRRDPVTRHYHPHLKLVSAEPAGRSLVQRAGPIMDELCRETSVTVELYAWRDAGLAMIDRREPDQAEVCVRARIGHTRDLTEIEALSQVVRVWPMGEMCDASAIPLRKLWAWDSGKQKQVTAARLKTVLHATQQRNIGIDLDINENGVRRYACPLANASVKTSDNQGIIALAQVCPPTALQPAPRLIDALQKAVAHWSIR